jgi:thioredoxin 1|tara:strand:+ start:100 stop:528 length:429 start_codon:yes stop_codon:yes gene_type:complete
MARWIVREYIKEMKQLLAAIVFTVSFFAGGCSGGDSVSSDTGSVSAEEFNKEIAAGVVLVDFWAPWCPPCRLQGPIVDDVAEKAKAYGKVIKLNVDDEPAVASKYGIRSIPTLIIFKDGEIQKQFQGLTDASTLIAAMKAAE